MVIPIAHRINTIEDSNSVPRSIGIEFDVHAYGSELVVSHDPFCKGVKLKNFLKHNKERFCAINIKEEGIEKEVIDLSLSLGMNNFFLFDVNLPQICKLGERYKNFLGLRISEYEKPNLEELRNFSRYLWIDSFKGQFWLNKEEILNLKRLEFNLCFVSPELHRPIIKKQLEFSRDLKRNYNLFGKMDSVCTKDYKIYFADW